MRRRRPFKRRPTQLEKEWALEMFRTTPPEAKEIPMASWTQSFKTSDNEAHLVAFEFFTDQSPDPRPGEENLPTLFLLVDVRNGNEALRVVSDCPACKAQAVNAVGRACTFCLQPALETILETGEHPKLRPAAKHKDARLLLDLRTKRPAKSKAEKPVDPNPEKEKAKP